MILMLCSMFLVGDRSNCRQLAVDPPQAAGVHHGQIYQCLIIVSCKHLLTDEALFVSYQLVVGPGGPPPENLKL
ncbi:hypothetical protein JB92DRAFT_2859392, partial [Gautieria morchelliformis]